MKKRIITDSEFIEMHNSEDAAEAVNKAFNKMRAQLDYLCRQSKAQGLILAELYKQCCDRNSQCENCDNQSNDHDNEG